MIRLDTVLTDQAAEVCAVILRHQSQLAAWTACPDQVRRSVMATDICVLWSLSQNRENRQQAR